MIAEVYSNNRNSEIEYKRYLIPGGYPIMIGESLFGPEDYQSLKRTHGITCVINTEPDRTDVGKLIEENLLQVGIVDDGSAITAQQILDVIKFVTGKLADKKKIHRFYVHCKHGNSVSPAIAYAILRSIYKISADQALKLIQRVINDYGNFTYHRTYLYSVDSYLES